MDDHDHFFLLHSVAAFCVITLPTLKSYWVAFLHKYYANNEVKGIHVDFEGLYVV